MCVCVKPCPLPSHPSPPALSSSNMSVRQYLANHPPTNLALPISGLLEAVRAGLVVPNGLQDLVPRRHDERPVLDDWVTHGFSGGEDKPGRFPGVRSDLCSGKVPFLVPDETVKSRHRLLLLRVGAEHGFALERVEKGVPASWQGLCDFAGGKDGEVEEPDGRVGQVLDALHAVAPARDYLHRGFPVIGPCHGDFCRVQIAVSRRGALEGLREVDPELDARTCGVVRVGHLGVDYAASCRHELQGPGRYGALRAGEVFMIDSTG